MSQMKNCLWLLVTGMVFWSTANAAEFHLQDDSVVVGKVLSLTDGKDLVIDTEHMGEVTLDWEAVEWIDETELVEIEFFDGNRVLGKIALDTKVLTISGDTTVRTDPGEVYSISEVKFAFREAIKVYTDLGFNVVRGNSRVTQVSFGAGVDYDVPGLEVSIEAKTFTNEQMETQDTRRTTLSTNYTKIFAQSWSIIGLYQFEADEQQDLDSRSILGGAFGKRVVNNRAQRLELFAGLALTSEDYVQASNEDLSETLFGMRYRLRSAADIDATIIHFQNMGESDQYRVQFDTTLNVDLIGELDLNVIFYDRYNSHPPHGIGDNDYGLVLGLRWNN